MNQSENNYIRFDNNFRWSIVDNGRQKNHHYSGKNLHFCTDC